jgi:hypothetical protein
LSENDINVTDAYGFVLQPNNQGICCMEIENLEESNAARIVKKAGFTVLEDKELYDM